MLLTTRLEQLGLTRKHASVYIALLELGGGTALEIAKKTQIKRTTIYNLLPELIGMGIITKTKIKKKTIYLAESPRNLVLNAEHKVDKAKELLPELEAIYNLFPYKPRITFYEGEAGMKIIYEDTLNSLKSGDVLLSFTGLEDFTTLMPKEYYRDYVARRIAQKIFLRVIVPDSQMARAWQKEARKTLREVKIISGTHYAFDGDIEIYKNKVAIISYKENFIGIIVESKEIANMLRTAFTLMWEEIKQS